jgi:phosphomevalonate kinase
VKVAAPGKLMLTGSYAVLEGAPAIVCAVSRLAVAGGESKASSVPPIAEVSAALNGTGEAEAPPVDVSDLFAGDQKLGLGSSAAAVVAVLGHQAALRGEDLAHPSVRRAIFDRARAAHAEVQGGGSGVDIAASVYGGVVRYQLAPPDAPSIRPVSLPKGLCLDAYWSGKSMRTSDMRARVDALKARSASLFQTRMGEVAAASVSAASAVDAGDARAFIDAARVSQVALSALGRDADAPIVPPFVQDIVRMAEEEGSVFVPSGAGGGDVFVRLGLAAPTSRFVGAARASGLVRLDLEVDVLGVRVVKKVGVL